MGESVDSVPPLPPRGTSLRSKVLRQIVLSALLPAVTVAFALMNVQAPHLALVVDEAWSGLNVLFGAGLLVCLVVGVLCAFESATRFVGLFTIAAVLVLNPVTFALTLGFFGLA